MFGSPSHREGDPVRFGAARPRSGARARWRRLGNDADEPDAESILRDDLVFAAAVLAADISPARIFLEVENLIRSEELPATEAFHSGIAHKLGHFGHAVSSALGCRAGADPAPPVDAAVILGRVRAAGKTPPGGTA